MVVPRTQKALMDGLPTTKGNFDFGGKTAKIVDESMANEIDTQHGLKGSGDVWVHQDENLEWHEHHDGNTDGRKVGIHHYTFAGVDTEKSGGHERVKVKTKDGFTYMSRIVAEEEGYEIVKGNIGNDWNAKHGKRKSVFSNISNRHHNQ